MIHDREDYNRIQDPEGKIGEDEPVFLLRAKDKHFHKVVSHWAAVVSQHDKALGESVQKFADDALEWQEKNGCKEPDTPEDLLWGR